MVRPGRFERPTYGLEVLCFLAFTLSLPSETAYLSMLIKVRNGLFLNFWVEKSRKFSRGY